MQGRAMDIPDILISRLEEDTERYTAWLRTLDPAIDPGLMLAGPFQSPEYPVWPRPHDNFHFPLGMRKLLALGFAGIRKAARAHAALHKGNRRAYLRLIERVYGELARTADRFAQSANAAGRPELRRLCRAAATRPPETFREACQIYWLATVFRIATSTVGRMDRHLWPFYRGDLKAGRITSEEARGLLAELLFRFEKRGAGRGDTLQNITLGGRSAAGKDETNEITCMILELALERRYIEPKINVRIHGKSPQRLLDLTAALQLRGTGICTVYNDDTIIEGLVRYGRPARIAADYCADGCTEIILDGHGETAFRYVDCVKAVEHTLFNGAENVPAKKRLRYYSLAQEPVDVKPPVARGIETGDFETMEAFEDFYRAYLAQLRHQVEVMLSTPYSSDENPLRPVTAATMPQVLEKAREPYRNRACWHTYGLFIGSLAAAANSIAAVRSLVYEKKSVSRKALLAALRDDFEGHPLLRQRCLEAPKFGNDDDAVDRIAADIARWFAAWVKKHNDRTGRPILPGLYNHLFHHTAHYVGATPDGRAFGDPVGEHLSPTPGTTRKGPTAIINSVAKIRTAEHIFGSTLHLNIPAASLAGAPQPAGILKSLTRAFCKKGGCVLNVNVLDTAQLLEAQAHPERYRDLVVRVWGFSYYFVGLSREMQHHVIARSKEPWSA
jgi:pyruvate-formate lyase